MPNSGIIAGRAVQSVLFNAAAGSSGRVVADISEFEKLEGCVICLSVPLPRR